MRATVKRGSTLRNRSHDETLGAWWKRDLVKEGRASDSRIKAATASVDSIRLFGKRMFPTDPSMLSSDSPPSRNDTVLATPIVVAAYKPQEKTPRSSVREMRVTFYTGLRMAGKAPNGFGARVSRWGVAEAGEGHLGKRRAVPGSWSRS